MTVRSIATPAASASPKLQVPRSRTFPDGDFWFLGTFHVDGYAVIRQVDLLHRPRNSAEAEVIALFQFYDEPNTLGGWNWLRLHQFIDRCKNLLNGCVCSE